MLRGVAGAALFLAPVDGEGTLERRPLSAPAFARIEVTQQDLVTAPALPPPSGCSRTGTIEITLPDGAHLVIDGSVDEAMLEGVIMALRR
ncbi:hypothetical protein [Edaphosphingomonas haloaromaticamans]|uniref:Uncharacterized protein n=1 Tax=Edaphosphingomonas haloaromaticamans TaxID=653954 RepID=A0A1S1HCS5_9SPHN|nr:hypothetical protein [Sphingomonas haloaromaticamans]OHT18260.1 hypothetical protein BHE75_00231 [Sphingomonas haloaromaticamans]